MTDENPKDVAPASVTADEYTAPAIEEIVTPDDLEREVAYAGTQSFPR